MITSLFEALKRAVTHIKEHPQLLFVMTLLLIMPFLFLYTGQQFLDVSRANQERLQKDKVGLMHDALVALLQATDFNSEIIAKSLNTITIQNPDIVDYKVSKEVDSQIQVLVAPQQEIIGTSEVEIDLYVNASLRTNESIIFEFYEYGDRMWLAYRAIRTEGGELYFIYTKHSLASIDQLFANREQKAYFSLLFIYCFVIALAYWHIRLTDYRYLYMKAQKTNVMKDLFTNMIAHELRAPLTAIRGYASLLQDSLLEKEKSEQASRIRESAERLLAILNDLLEVARLQSGKMSVVREDVDISKVVTVVLDELGVGALEKHIALIHEGTDTSHIVTADKKRMHQAFTNLVSNAIKYTEKGSITIEVTDVHAFVEVRVKDTGMGIDVENQKKLFAPFFRVDSADVSNITGTGLGMWISKELIELMGGSIGVESIKGVGTHIVVRFTKTIGIS
jgi:signal transduction histidine kinase